MIEDVRTLLEGVAAGSIPVDEAERILRRKPFEDLGFATVDLHRHLLQGATEVIYGAGKTADQIAAIVDALQDNGQQHVLITRLAPEKARFLEEAGVDLSYEPIPQVGVVGGMPQPLAEGYVLVASAGTSDMPVAEEAALTAQMLGCKVVRAFDVGVAASAIVAVAGMEGALASVLGGLANCPVIAVPTSVGYGASFGGVAALLSMLNSCASGVSVVNIDNGFGAAYSAAMICRRG